MLSQFLCLVMFIENPTSLVRLAVAGENPTLTGQRHG